MTNLADKNKITLHLKTLDLLPIKFVVFFNQAIGSTLYCPHVRQCSHLMPSSHNGRYDMTITESNGSPAEVE